MPREVRAAVDTHSALIQAHVKVRLHSQGLDTRGLGRPARRGQQRVERAPSMPPLVVIMQTMGALCTTQRQKAPSCVLVMA